MGLKKQETEVMGAWKDVDLKEAINTSFLILLTIYLLAVLSDQFQSDMIARYISVDYLMIFVIIFGALWVVIRRGESITENIEYWGRIPRFYLFTVIVGLVGALMIFYKLEMSHMGLGYLTYLIPILGGSMIVVCFILAVGIVKPEKEVKERPDEVHIKDRKVATDEKLKGKGSAYCIKCKAEREMKNVRIVTMKNGRKARKGVCSVCGSGMYKMI